MFVLEFVFVILALLGSCALWARIFNTVHAEWVPSSSSRTVNAVTFLCPWLVIALLAYWYANSNRLIVDMLSAGDVSIPLLYVVVCWAYALLAIFYWMRNRYADQTDVLIANHTTNVNVLATRTADNIGTRWITGLARIPGNQVLDLAIHEKEIRLPRLPRQWDGLSIAHLSDTHLTGRIGKAYFDEMVQRTNQMDADLITITGDIVDRPQCLDWIQDIFGQLRARAGVYFILGNHDMRIDADQLRQLLTGCGLIDLAGRWSELDVDGLRIVLAGNEQPWLRPPADMSTCPDRHEDGTPLRFVLSHSPDQIQWARGNDVDLMLAGHTHGGQIRLPWIGPVVSASRYGGRYAGGTYYVDPTVLHVSRGLSQTKQIRINCPPELAKLVLRSGAPS